MFTGEGDQSFCAGGDLYSFKNSGHNLINEVREFIVSLHGAISKFCRIKAPIIASINGVAAGAGLSFASFPSFAIASENATFVSSYTNVGLTPDASSSYFLPKIIGHRRYMELVLTNKTLSVDEALNWGLINKIVKPNKLLEETINSHLKSLLGQGRLTAHGWRDVMHGWRIVIHGWRNAIHGCHPWMEKCHPWMEVSSVVAIHGCHPWMKTTDDGRSLNHVLTET